MARKAGYTVNKNGNESGANLGFEQTLWAAADKMRGHVDPSEYKHVVLGLIFLKYISDAFDEKHNELILLVQDPQSDLYIAEPSERYQVTEDRDEYKAENVFWVPEAARWSYIQSNARQPTIGKIIDDAMEAIEKENPTLKGVLSKDYARPTLDKHRLGELVDLLSKIGLGDRESRSKDILGRVYEYFLGQFAGQEGRGGGERLRQDVRWKYGVPPVNNANFAWVQHIIHHLAPTGIAGFVLANGSLSSNTSGEGDIRKNIVEADLVDCIVALPGQLFYGTGIPACLWFLTRNKADGKFRPRKGETLFLDCRKMGHLIDRTHRELSGEEVRKIAGVYHAWRGEPLAGEYTDAPGFCKTVTLADIREHGHGLTPGRYVGAEDVEDDGEPFEEKMALLTARLEAQFKEGAHLEVLIRDNLRGLKI